MNQTAVKDLKEFRKEAIEDLDALKKSYLKMVKSEEDIQNLERAVRLLPGLLKTEENLLTSVEQDERRKRLEDSLEPLFAVLRKVLGAEFDRKREDIIKALEDELKRNGA
ncbi:hypothetical protein KAX06_02315 [candidate division WOR-3 bacterium]|nr:hypothetical protein [candidate division WOR-3 bacterium]MEA3312606.1 hypothetical protein [candidate division WOR-3 bacterium]